MAVIVVARDSGLFDGAVHSLDLPVCPWMLNLGRPVLDAVFAAGSTKYVCASDVVLFAVGELDAIAPTEEAGLVR